MSKLACSGIVLLTACGRIDFDGSDALVVRSCIDLPRMCGADHVGDCCESPRVPSGIYSRSFDVAGDGMFADPSWLASVREFRLDKYEVTVARFRQFVAAGGGTRTSPPAAGDGAHPYIASSGWDPSWNANLITNTSALISVLHCDLAFQTWTDEPGPNESEPINCVTWYEAMAFCAWDGGFLPTEAEWNYAAAGGDEQRAYPWSNPPSSLANDDSTYASYYVDTSKQCFGDMMNECSHSDLIDVGTKPAGNGRWGHSDLAGNVWEWGLDEFFDPYTEASCFDCAELAPASMRVTRGGSLHNVAVVLRTAARGAWPPDTRNIDFGVRCARLP